ncbi:MAG: hypothetical protein ACOYMA_14830 [Bacteroidia bacterium]
MNSRKITVIFILLFNFAFGKHKPLVDYAAFVLVENKTEYFVPSDRIADTIIKTYKIGSYQFRAIAIRKYAEVGSGILEILEVKYSVNGQKLEFINQVDFEFNSKMNLKPVCKIQSDSSLIILLISSTTPNKSGMCGACTYDEYNFWHLKGSKLDKMFTITNGISTDFSSYEYYKNQELITGSLFEEANDYNRNTQSYWKNNSTYVFQIENDNYKRNFYIQFDTLKKMVSVVPGKKLKQ